MTKNKHKQIFVTGGTGLIGSYLLRYLVQQGYTNIRASRRAGSSMDLVAAVVDKIEWVVCDVLDSGQLEDAMDTVKQVYHCAALVSYDVSDKKDLYKINQEGTENVVNAALYAGVEKIVHVSSVAAIGRNLKETAVTEKTIFEKDGLNTHYAISKHLAEAEVWRGMAEGLDAVIVNPSTVLGSGFWNTGTLKFFKLAWESFAWYAPGMTGFVDVRDVVKLMTKAMNSDTTGERIILSSQDLTYKYLMDQIAQKIGRPPARKAMKNWMRGFVWRWEWFVARIHGTRPSITKEVAQQVSLSYTYNNSKSIEAYDFTYRPVLTTISDIAAQFKVAVENGFVPQVLPLD